MKAKTPSRRVSITLDDDESRLIEQAVPLAYRSRQILYHTALVTFCRALIQNGSMPMPCGVDIREATPEEMWMNMGLTPADIRYCKLEGIDPHDYRKA